MIFVTVGTHEQPFNRLVQKIDELKKDGTIREDVIIQTGFSTYEPKYCQWSKLIPYQQMVKNVADARVVITHGGPASFIMPLQMGKTPIVVPRQHQFNEHVNDHQVEFARNVAQRMGTIIPVEDIDTLGDIITNYYQIVAGIEMLAGWAGGCKKRIAHSHNTQCEQVQADKWLRPLFYLLYTDAFACGEDAGKWLFGTRSFIVLNNGRNLEKFAFDPHLREKMRLRYKIDSELAFGHVGGFNPQKNHKFVLDVFRAIIQEEPNAKCFFIGTGPLKNVIEKQSTDLKDNIIFVGNTDEVPAYLDMMDGMILPSLFEGLPLVAIEWQINGLPCILSDTITLQCAVTDELKFMSLDVSPYQWARRIIIDAKKNAAVRAEKSAESKEMVKRAGFDISENVKLLEKAYTE